MAQKACIGPVIELTDSDSVVTDEVPTVAPRRSRSEPSPVAGPLNVAGPSNAKPTPTTYFSSTRTPTIPEKKLLRAPMQPNETPRPPATPPPEEPIDPISHTLAQILEIIPGIDPENTLGLVQERLPAAFGGLAGRNDVATWTEPTTHGAEHVIGLIFEGGAYPKVVDMKRKGRRR
ncbi:hypothetical protein M413DRAFT_13617 [Hebeloma cylindrosporum]|uniref:Uncharacterized protein n=1 Tax=Hebeloma cylindrosporum TaxID=76867 RepID=A0A0C2Y7T1_HEBCY|nr:hypothetical protein M413DRAFT_13617 [Hebeloma cylindrosporum h7]